MSIFCYPDSGGVLCLCACKGVAKNLPQRTVEEGHQVREPFGALSPDFLGADADAASAIPAP